MNNVKTLSLAYGLALSLGLTACQTQPRNANAEELKEISVKLDALDRKLGALERQRPPSRQAPARPTVGQLYRVPVDADDAFRGGKKAKVTIVEASEFACPYCAQLAGVTDELLNDYDDGQLKVVSKNFVVHPSVATKPALATCAADKQGKFTEFESMLWKRAWQGEGAPRLKADQLAQGALDSIAKELSLDMGRFHKDMNDTCTKTIARQRQEMSKLGVRGTPALYINGVYYGGPRTVEGLSAAIEQELKKADAALSKGAELGDYYDNVIKKGKLTI